jgi:Rho GTPase-activating protein 18/28/40
LRVAGSRARMDVAAAALQSDFYGPHREEKAIRALDALSAHDLGSLLKKLLRELPQPLLTAPLLDSFYYCHGEYFLKHANPANVFIFNCLPQP